MSVFVKKGRKEEILVGFSQCSQHSSDHIPTYEGGSSREVEYVSVKGVGKYSREQVVDMFRIYTALRNLDDIVGLIVCLKTSVVQDKSRDDCIRILEQSYPTKKIRGNHSPIWHFMDVLWIIYGRLFVAGLQVFCRLDYTQLLSLRPRQWIAALPILAFCDMVGRKERGLISCVPTETVYNRVFDLSDNIKRQLRQCQASPIIFMPINISLSHWVSLLIRTQDMSIEIYEPMGKTATFVSLEQYAERLANGMQRGMCLLWSFHG